MADHEAGAWVGPAWGHIKEITWEFEQTGEHEGAIFPVLHDYANPADAPERLLPHGAAAPAAACDAAACSKLLVAEEGLRLTEAALLLVLLGVVLAWLGSHLVLRRRRQPHTPAVAADPAATPVLADFPRFPHPAGDLAFPACSNSSFVTKAEAFMRFAGIPYAKQTGFPDPATSPKSQLPYLQRGAEIVGDSHFIIQHLVSSGAAPRGLLYPPGARDRAAVIALARMCDTDLAAAIVYERWVSDEGWARCRQELMGPFRMMAPVRAVVSRMARKAMFVRAWEQGIARHSDADRLGLVAEELSALADLLGEQPFLFGDSPHAVDASAFGVLDQMAAAALNPRLAALVQQHPNLVAYRRRIADRFFGDQYREEVQWVEGGGGAAAVRGGKAPRPGRGAEKEE